MDDLTALEPGELDPKRQLRLLFAALDAYGESFLAAAQRVKDPDEIDLAFHMRVMDDAFPERIEQARRGLKALALAPSIAVCQALLRGEAVPWNTLDYWQAKRYGLRQRITDRSRLTLDDFNDIPKP